MTVFKEWLMKRLLRGSHGSTQSPNQEHNPASKPSSNLTFEPADTDTILAFFSNVAPMSSIIYTL